MKDCIFCQIVDSRAPSQKIYGDDKVVAFLSTTPIRPGHILVIPKIHEPDLYNLADDYYLAVMAATKKLALLLDEIYKPKKVGLMVAGWDIPHAHVHLVPMQDYHDLTSKLLLDGTAKLATDRELVIERKRILKQ